MYYIIVLCNNVNEMMEIHRQNKLLVLLINVCLLHHIIIM